MESLTSFIEKDISNLLKESGAFFAFGEKQFNEQKEQGVKYISDGTGLLVPKDTYKEFNAKYEAIVKTGSSRLIEKYGADAIIRYEYFNHEQQLGYFQNVEESDTYHALSSFIKYPGFDIENIQKVFKQCYQEAINNDYF